jgi:gas vesicle protein
MDDELAKARQVKDEADGVDIYRYRRRFRLFKAILLGAALAGLTSLIMAMVDGKRNPCERVRDYLCKKDAASMQCKSYEGIVDDSVHEAAAEMRQQLRAQCQSKIERLKEEENVTVP